MYQGHYLQGFRLVGCWSSSSCDRQDEFYDNSVEAELRPGQIIIIRRDESCIRPDCWRKFFIERVPNQGYPKEWKMPDYSRVYVNLAHRDVRRAMGGYYEKFRRNPEALVGAVFTRRCPPGLLGVVWRTWIRGNPNPEYTPPCEV